MDHLNQVFQANGFPETLVKKTLTTKSSPLSATSTSQQRAAPKILCTPYIRGLSEKIKKVCAPLRVKPVCRPMKTQKWDLMQMKTGPQRRSRQELYTKFPVRIARRCMWVKQREHWKSDWVSTDKQWDEETPRTALQFMFKRQTTASTGMVPQSKDEPKGSGRGGLWKPSRSGNSSWTWTSTAAFSFPWSGTQSRTHPIHIPHSHSPSFALFLFFSKQYVYYTWLLILCSLLYCW